MSAIKHVLYAASATTLLCAACATSPEVQNRRQAMEADIEMILSEPLDPTQFGETKRCLADREYRNFRALDDKRLLFQGRGDKLWINTLRMSCPDLRHGSVLRINSFNWARICDADRFVVGEWFDWPWYRRWPWHWSGDWGMGVPCSLGKFQPVTKLQVAEIEAVLRSR